MKKIAACAVGVGVLMAVLPHGGIAASGVSAGVAYTPLGMSAEVIFARPAGWPRATVVAFHTTRGTEVAMTYCRSELDCTLHQTLADRAALVDHGGMNRPISLDVHVNGVGAVKLQFRSVQLGNQTLAGCSTLSGTYSFEGTDAEGGVAVGTVGDNVVRGTICAASGRDSVLTYAIGAAATSEL